MPKACPGMRTARKLVLLLECRSVLPLGETGAAGLAMQRSGNEAERGFFPVGDGG